MIVKLMFSTKYYLLPFLFFGFLMLGVSCQDTVTSFEDEPPPLPPERSMQMDFSPFSSEEDAQDSFQAKTAGDESYSHFANAAFRVMVIKSVVNVNLAIPRILLKAATHAEPEFNEEGEWVWSYSREANDELYEVRLVASRENEEEIRWRMYITHPDKGLEGRLFFEGSTTSNGREGTWTYYDLRSSEAESPVSEVSWYLSDDNMTELRLEVLSDRHGHLGDTIEYNFGGQIKTVTYYNAEEDQITEIRWNVETREGFLAAPGYNNGEPVCWDSGLQNTPCS